MMTLVISHVKKNLKNNIKSGSVSYNVGQFETRFSVCFYHFIVHASKPVCGNLIQSYSLLFTGKNIKKMASYGKKMLMAALQKKQEKTTTPLKAEGVLSLQNKQTNTQSSSSQFVSNQKIKQPFQSGICN